MRSAVNHERMHFQAPLHFRQYNEEENTDARARKPAARHAAVTRVTEEHKSIANEAILTEPYNYTRTETQEDMLLQEMNELKGGVAKPQHTAG